MFKSLAILKNRNFFLLWLGQIISQLGDRLDQMALIGFIAARSPGKTFALASLLAFTILPVFIIGPVAGVYVDRWDRRKTMYICDFFRGVLVLLIPLIILDREGSLFPLYFIVFILFSIGRFFVPAKLAIVPDLVKPDQLLLANSLVNTTGMIAAVMGFGIGGFVVHKIGVKGGFYLDAVSFFISSLLIFFIRYNLKMNIKIAELGKEIASVIRQSVVAEIKDGIKHLLSQKQMRAAIAVLFLVWAALGAVYTVIIVFVQETLKTFTLDLGFLIMFLGIGLFVGAISYGTLGKVKNCFKTIFSSLFISGLVLAIFAFSLIRFPHFYTAGILAFLLGLAVAPIMTAVNTLIQNGTQDNMRGKIFSSLEVVMHLAFLLFMFLGSIMAEFKYIGRQGVLVGAGILFAIIGIVGILRLRVREKC